MSKLIDEESASPSLEEQLAQLRDNGAHRYDPAQFSYIDAMARRAHLQRQTVSPLVRQRALVALDQYHVKFALAQKTAAVALADGLSQFPHVSEQLQQHFDDCDFLGLTRLLAKSQRSKTTQSLADLAGYVAQSKPVVETREQSFSFDDTLRQAEQKLVNGVLRAGAKALRTDTHADADELSSIHYFRESLVRRNADKLVTQAIREIPEGAGPLNSQKLIVQSLASMRDLSPHYLNRFVAYIDTLLWLEQADEK
ncbi:MAG: hypothetical protein ACJAZ0_000538 [Halioglobus sp.]